MPFENLEQRIAQTYMDMFPSFVPDENASVSVSEQEQFYNMIKGLYRLAFDEPLLFVAKLHEDDFYPHRYNKSAYGKPALQVNMKKMMKAIDELLEDMYHAGQGAPVKLTKRQSAILARLGIHDFSDLPAAWVWMSTRCDADLNAFSHCFFKKNYPYTSDIFARMFDEAVFRRLENWMLEVGYMRENFAASWRFNNLSYINPKWSAESSNGFLSKVKHTGISIMVEPFMEYPSVLGLHIPNGIVKTYLESFDSMSPTLQKFVINTHTKCWNCNFCIQTDKTGTRPKAYVPTIYEAKEYLLCPRFPGYSYGWTSISDELAERLIEALSFMDTLLE